MGTAGDEEDRWERMVFTEKNSRGPMEDLEARHEADRDRIAALEEKCTLLSASLKQADDQSTVFEEGASRWRILAEEREAAIEQWRARVAELEAGRDGTKATLTKACKHAELLAREIRVRTTERDAARAQVAQLREALVMLFGEVCDPARSMGRGGVRLSVECAKKVDAALAATSGPAKEG